VNKHYLINFITCH